MKLTYTFSLSAIAALATMGSVFANHVDFIVDGGFMLSANDGSVTGLQTGDPGNIIGGEREVFLTSNSGPVDATFGVPAGPGTVGPGAGSIAFVAGVDDDGGAIGSLGLLYDGVGSTGLGSDFATNWNAIRISLGSVTDGAVDIRLTVGDSDSSGMAALGNISTGGNYDFFFGDTGFAGIDFTMVDSVRVDIESIVGGTGFEISAITREVVPEPGVSLLAVLGGFGLVIRRRRA